MHWCRRLPQTFGDLQDLRADISEVPEHCHLTSEEWDARQSDSCRADELYLNERGKQPSAAKGH